jgi:predicted sulfurtransferase
MKNGGRKMKWKQLRWLTVVLSLGIVLAAVLPAMSQEVPRISKEDLKEMLGKPDVVIVDVRTGSDWNASTSKIKGAVREEADKVDSWIEKYPRDKTLVFY